jgi:hypothetical protein
MHTVDKIARRHSLPRLRLDLEHPQRRSLATLHYKLVSLCNDQLAIGDA